MKFFRIKRHFFFAISFFLISHNAFSSNSKYIYPLDVLSFSNYGSAGIIQNPSARFHEEGTLAFSWSHNEPYLRGSVIAYPFNWLEASFQYTDINNILYSDVPDFSGSQTLKDKSFDAKIMLVKEQSLLPQVAVGFRDIGGTGRFASEYIVASKKVKNFLDVTLGLGWGNLNGNSISKNPLTYFHESFTQRNDDQELGGKLNIKNFFSGDAGFFAGIEYSLPRLNGIKIKAEYDGTNYETESLPLTQKSKLNVGIVYPVNSQFTLKFSSTRGNTFNFGFSYALQLGKKNSLNVVKNKPSSIDYPDIVKRVTSKSDENVYKAALLYLKNDGLSLQNASINDQELHVVYSHSTYRSSAMAIGRAISILDDIAPSKIKSIKVSEVNAGMGIYSASISRESFNRYKKLKLPEVAVGMIKFDEFLYESNAYQFNPDITYPINFINMGPKLVSQIGGPDGFYFGDLKWSIDSEILFSRKLTLSSAFDISAFDNLGDLKLNSDSILPHVRTDIVKYLQATRSKFSIRRMQLNYFDELSKSFFIKYSAGIFEGMFAGYGFESLYRPGNSNYAVGLEAWNVYQRDFRQLFKKKDYQTLTGHLNFYYMHQNSGVLVNIKAGRYLAKDSGFTFDFSRNFKSGLRIGAFFTLTDISEEEFGEGSFDKGFYFWIPVELFSQRYFKRTFGWGLRPITRDGGQSLVYSYPLWGVTDSVSGYNFMRVFDDLYE